MKHNVLAPNVGESITEVSILKWKKQQGEAVKPGDLLLEIESDKATVEIVAEHSGALQILKPEGERIPVGAVIGMIDDEAKGTVAAATTSTTASTQVPNIKAPQIPTTGTDDPSLSPAVRKIVAEKNIDPKSIAGTGKDGRVTKGDVLNPVARPTPMPAPRTPSDGRPERRVQMTMLRSKIAERLVQAQHNAAILTTFNEVDLSAVMAIRNKEKDAFKAKHGFALSFMSFFTLASLKVLQEMPEVNAWIEGKEVVYHDYIDIGVAVSTERGLVVPVLKNAQNMGMVAIEKAIADLAVRARDAKLSIAELQGGTFTISNGGVFGSLLSTPILNYPQSAILGMHKIQERPVAVNGKVEIRPMMYLALSYDHRLIDGRGAVTFLVKLKELLENPTQLKLEF